ncbi:MAG: YciI family protein [Flavisolibacter sp.]
MERKYYVLKLIPSRKDFAQTMNQGEKNIMVQHVAYWKELMKKGNVIVFGPVLDPLATYGLGIIAVNSEIEVKEFISEDPASKINTYEYAPMLAVLPEI